MKYTIEEIEAVVYKYGSHNDQNSIIAELTDKPTFEVGQVVFDPNCGFEGNYFNVGDRCFKRQNREPMKRCRALNQTECGPYVQALVKALKKLQAHNLPRDANYIVDTVLSQMPEGWDGT